MARYYCARCGHAMPRSRVSLCARCAHERDIYKLALEIERLLKIMPLQTRRMHLSRYPTIPTPDDFPEQPGIIRLKRCRASLERQRDHLLALGQDLTFNDRAYAGKQLKCINGTWQWVEAVRRG